jgi:hypothetical protein
MDRCAFALNSVGFWQLETNKEVNETNCARSDSYSFLARIKPQAVDFPSDERHNPVV